MEICLYTSLHTPQGTPLKSDRFGMEIMALNLKRISPTCVKIRPFRYGNLFPDAKKTDFNELKSDRFGMEIYSQMPKRQTLTS